MAATVLSEIDHILKRPDTYVGDNPLYKSFDEILVNAMDKDQKTSDVTRIEITVTDDTITIKNNGSGLPLTYNESVKAYNPEVCFGHLRASTNFDDTVKRTTGGRNGIGAKAANVFSTEFEIECLTDGSLYTQKWTNNMKKCYPHKLKSKKGKDYLLVRFKPDLERLKIPKIPIDQFKQRAFDAAACTRPQLSIHFNGESVGIKHFKDYVKHFTEPVAFFESENGETKFEVGIAYSDGWQQTSFVNGITTPEGGVHVDRVWKKIQDAIPVKIKESVWLFVKARVYNPAFSSQAKERCTKTESSYPDIPDAFIKKIKSSEIMATAKRLAEAKEEKVLNKTDGKKTKTINVPKLVDAGYAGTKKSGECILILTEGDSAKAGAVSGRSVLDPQKIGVFPLKGKPVNASEVGVKKLSSNEEYTNIKTILGLSENTKKISDLRYGSVIIMTDADLDGSHIKGLVMNMFRYRWPELFKAGLIKGFMTPIVKATRGRVTKSFYTKQSFDAFDSKGWAIKYYKGLGTSSGKEFQEYFRNFAENTVEYKYSEEGEFDLAFDKKKADERKEWLSTYDENDIIEGRMVTTKDFIHRELKHFSMADNFRSIPHVLDGLKPSQRKVLWSCFKRNLTKDIKVAQLAGYVSEHAAYHHGEDSLNKTIIGMAQNFAGSNNINLLVPSGQFGSRIKNGADSASPRYIFTRLTPDAAKYFPDDPYDAQIDDGLSIEPKRYVPIVPWVLINGSKGIGTGYSCDIPMYNPKDVIENTIRRMSDTPLKEMTPWYRGFSGTISDNKTHGVYTEDDKSITVTELPIGLSMEQFKELLDLHNFKYTDLCTDEKAHYKITVEKNCLARQLIIDALSKPISSNLTFITDTGIEKMTIQQIFDIHHDARKSKYVERKKRDLEDLTQRALVATNQYKFVRAVIKKKLDLNNKMDVIIEYLDSHNFDRIDDRFDYLTDMKLSSLTVEKVESLKAKAAKLTEEKDILEKKTPVDLWKEDLEKVK